MTRWCERHDPAVPLRRGERCLPCERDRDARRGGRIERGYGAEHQRMRRQLALMLPAPCLYCRGMVSDTDRWVAAHLTDGDHASPRAIAHAICNERAKVRPSTVGYTL